MNDHFTPKRGDKIDFWTSETNEGVTLGTDEDEDEKETCYSEMNETFGSEEFELRILLWEELKKFIKVPEHDEVRRLIGNDLIDKNEDLYKEIEFLFDILKDLREKNLSSENELKAGVNLFDTPAKQLMREELRLILNDIRHSIGKSFDNVIHSNPKDSKIINYIQPLEDSFGKGYNSRPSTASYSSRPSTASSRPSTASSKSSKREVEQQHREILNNLKSVLNAFDIDEELQRFRNLFKEEHDLLLNDIDYLHECINVENEYKMKILTDSSKLQPSLEELRKFRSNLLEKWEKEKEKIKFLNRMNELPEVTKERKFNSAGRIRQSPKVKMKIPIDPKPPSSPSPIKALRKIRYGSQSAAVRPVKLFSKR